MLPRRSKNAILIDQYQEILGEKIEIPDEFIDEALTFEIMDTPVLLGQKKEKNVTNDTIEELTKSMGKAELEELLGTSIDQAEDLTRSLHSFHSNGKDEQEEIKNEKKNEKPKVKFGNDRLDEAFLFDYWDQKGKMLNPMTNEEVDFYSHDHELFEKINKFMSALKVRVDEKNIPNEYLEEDKKARELHKIQEDDKQRKVMEQENAKKEQHKKLVFGKYGILAPHKMQSTITNMIMFGVFKRKGEDVNDEKVEEPKQNGGPKLGSNIEDVD